jgi:uncharacterized membrane protein
MLTTAYPSQQVSAGDTVKITLQLENNLETGQTARLSVRDVPQGWEAQFKGGGRVINAAFVEPDQERTITLEVKVPEGAEAGPHNLTVIAKSAEAEARLEIELVVGEAAPLQISLKPDLPIIKGSPNSTFSFRLKLKNESDQELLVSLEASVPVGFVANIKKAYGGQELTSLPVDAGGQETIDVSVRALGPVEAGEYPILVRASAGDVVAIAELTAVVSGDPDLTLTTPDERLSGKANAGRENTVELLLRNQGTAPALGVKLEATPPRDWEVTFEPEFIESLAPGEEAQVTARITVPDKAIAGDYMVTMRARPDNGSTERVEFRITVTTSTLWGAVGLLLIAAALGVVYLAVMRFGRR